MFILVALMMLGYGVLHSWLASTRLKESIRHLVGDQRYYGLYRASFNLIAVVTLVPVLGLVIFLPGNIR